MSGLQMQMNTDTWHDCPRLWEENNNIQHKMSTRLLKLWHIQYLKKAVTTQNYSHEIIQATSVPRMPCYHSAKMLSYFTLPSKKSIENYIKLELNLLFWKVVELSSQHNNGTQNVSVEEVLNRRFGNNKNEVTGTTGMCMIRSSVVCTFTLHSKHNQINRD